MISKRILFLPLILLCTLLSMAQNRVTVTPAAPMDKAVSGHYAGWLKGELSTYGGCNFPDSEYGEWYGYLHRDGTVAQPAKGNIFKGPFHIPRMMIKSYELCKELTK